MVTEKQIIANRQNGLKGGVKSEEGKAIVRMNPLKHGLLCRQDIVLFNENELALTELRVRLMSDLNPQGELEMMLFDTIVSTFWRLERVSMLETCHIQDELGFSKNKFYVADYSVLVNSLFGDDRTMANLHRYEAALERKFYRALHELQRVQMAKQGGKPPAPVAIDVDISHEG